MNKQQIIQKLSYIATSVEGVELIRSNLFRFMAELTAEGITEEKSYSVRAFPAEVRQEIILRDHFTCAYCNRHGTIDTDPDNRYWTVDHVIPFSKGGSTCADNGVLSCAQCNSEKRDMSPAQYIKWIRFQTVATPVDDFAEGQLKIVVEQLSSTNGDADISEVEVHEVPTDWNPVAAEFFRRNPHARQVDLAKHMADLANDGRPHNNFSGLANKMYRQYSPNSDRKEVMQ